MGQLDHVVRVVDVCRASVMKEGTCTRASVPLLMLRNSGVILAMARGDIVKLIAIRTFKVSLSD